MRKRDIVNELLRNRDRIDTIISGLDRLDSDDLKISRRAYYDIVLTFFEFMDHIGKVEIETYNYLKKRGWKSHGMQSKQKIKKRAR